MSILDLLGRLLLGGNFFLFGCNGFFHWIPLPATRDEMSKFVQALIETGYLMTFVKVIEILAGICLLTGFFVPLALLALTPLVFGIVSAQLILNRGRGWGITLVTLVPFVVLFATRWADFAPLLRP